MADVTPTGPTPPAGSPQTSTSAAAAPAEASGGLTPNVAGALAYVFGLITGIIFLVLEPLNKNKFVRFHAFQSIFLNVAIIAFAIVWNIFTFIVLRMIGFLAIILVPVSLLIWLGFFLLWLFLMFQAYSNKEFKLPIIGDIAAKQAGA